MSQYSKDVYDIDVHLFEMGWKLSADPGWPLLAKFPLNFSELPQISSTILQFLANIHLTPWRGHSTILMSTTSTSIYLEWDGSSQQVHVGLYDRICSEFLRIASN